MVCIFLTGGCGKEPSSDSKIASQSSASVQATNQPAIQLDTLKQAAKPNESKSEFADLNGLKIERIDENTVRVTEGFDYESNVDLNDHFVIRIKDFLGDIIIPEPDSLVPAGHPTAVGVTYIFPKSGMVWPDRKFTYTSLATNASMEFTKEGVVLKSFKIQKSH